MSCIANKTRVHFARMTTLTTLETSVDTTTDTISTADEPPSRDSVLNFIDTSSDASLARARIVHLLRSRNSPEIQEVLSSAAMITADTVRQIFMVLLQRNLYREAISIAHFSSQRHALLRSVIRQATKGERVAHAVAMAANYLLHMDDAELVSGQPVGTVVIHEKPQLSPDVLLLPVGQVYYATVLKARELVMRVLCA